ncbi:hypothetical protein SMICM304S_01175 [Streptomyces microflavus]
MYDYARTYWSGRSVRNVLATAATRPDPPPSGWPTAPNCCNSSWSSGTRRTAVRSSRPGFAYAARLLRGHPLDLPGADVRRVDRGTGRGLRLLPAAAARQHPHHPSDRHFDIFDQYDRVFAFVDAHPELSVWRPVLFRRMLNHFCAVYASRDGLPHPSRAAFFRRATASCRRYRTPGAPAPRRAQLRHGLMRLGARRTYRALAASRRIGEGSAGRRRRPGAGPCGAAAPGEALQGGLGAVLLQRGRGVLGGSRRRGLPGLAAGADRHPPPAPGPSRTAPGRSAYLDCAFAGGWSARPVPPPPTPGRAVAKSSESRATARRFSATRACSPAPAGGCGSGPGCPGGPRGSAGGPGRGR